MGGQPIGANVVGIEKWPAGTRWAAKSNIGRFQAPHRPYCGLGGVNHRPDQLA